MNIKYINIPSKLVFDTNVPALAKIIYGQIVVLAHFKGYCDVTNMYFVKINKCSRSTISRMIRILKENNYIKIEYVGSRKIYIDNPY